MKIKKLSLLLLILIMLPFICAEQTVKTLLIPLGYEALATGGQVYYYNLSVDYPDGIEKVMAMEILVIGDYAANTKTYAGFLVGETVVYCTPNEWTIFITSNNYEMSFDCTSLLQGANWQGGDITFIMMSDTISANVKTRTRITYQNKPAVNMEMFGTEYEAGQNAKIWLQLINENNSAYINDAICLLHLYTPENTQFLEKTSMEYFEDGVYYYDLIAPVKQGVYPAIAECYYEAVQVNKFANDTTIVTGTEDGGTIGDTFAEDSVTYDIKEAGSNPKRFEFVYNYTDMCGMDVDEELLTGMTIHWVGTWNSVTNDNVVISIYNYTSGTWIELGNSIPSVAGAQSVSNLVSMNNVTSSGIVSLDGTAAIRFMDTDITDGGSTVFETDLTYVLCDQLTSPVWTNVKGASEMHITSDKLYTATVDSGELRDVTFSQDFRLTYTVASGVHIDTEDIAIELGTFNAFPCPDVLNVQIHNDTDDTWYNSTFITRLDDRNVCLVHFHMTLEEGANYEVRLVMENFWKEQILGDRIDASINLDAINLTCEFYRQANGLEIFNIPLNSTVDPLKDNFYNFCHAFLSAHIKYVEEYATFGGILSGNFNFTGEQMNDLEGRYYDILQVQKQLDDYANTMLIAMITTDAYSIEINNNVLGLKVPIWVGFWSNASAHTSLYSGVGNLSNVIWGADTRTLTEFNYVVNISTPINNTEVAEAVWNYDGTIILNILEQIASTIWEYIGGVAEIIS